MVFKNTYKQLFRSPSFWLTMLVVGIALAYFNISVAQYSVFSQEHFEVIYDTDPRYILDFDTYLKVVINHLNSVLDPFAGLLIVTAVSVVVIRDYRDNFFEIEKATGQSTAGYLFPRLLSLIVVLFGAIAFFHLFSLHIYVYTRGGVDGLPLPEYLIDSTIRSLRAALLIGLPYTVFYVSFTYCCGALFKSGFASAVGGFIYVFFCYTFGKFYTTQYSKLVVLFQDWLKPIQMKVFWFLYDYDTEEFENTITHFETSSGTVAFCIIFLAGISMLYSLISYFRIRKRTV